jgi:hypothetical protein
MKPQRKVIIQVVKVVIGVGCAWLIAQRLYDSYSAENLSSLREIFSANNLLLLMGALLLMPLNWGIEVKKWVIITAPTEKISFGNAWQSVWTGVCIGNLTPGRLGEFAGRILFFSAAVRAKIATSHFVCGITQLVVTIVLGCTGLLFYSNTMSSATWGISLTIELILLILLTIVLVRINRVVTWLLSLTRLKKFNFEGLSYPPSLLRRLLGWSVIRYIVFSFQFFLILHACGVGGDILPIAAAIAVMYLVLSTIPMISMIEVGVRAYVVMQLFGSFEENVWQLTAASTLLWLINIVLPSVIGYVFILKNDFSFSKNGMA